MGPVVITLHTAHQQHKCGISNFMCMWWRSVCWTHIITCLAKKVQQCLHLLQRLRTVNLPKSILKTFSGRQWKASWPAVLLFGMGIKPTISDHMTLQHTMKTAEKNVKVFPLPTSFHLLTQTLHFWHCGWPLPTLSGTLHLAIWQKVTEHLSQH